ncbi:MAG: hypothetical protein ACRDRU_19140 [Pseudonocardiaceae bacterium]
MSVVCRLATAALVLNVGLMITVAAAHRRFMDNRLLALLLTLRDPDEPDDDDDSVGHRLDEPPGIRGTGCDRCLIGAVLVLRYVLEDQAFLIQ